MRSIKDHPLNLGLPKELESDGLINRTVFPEVPPRVEYSLTELGKEIHPVLKGMYKGGILFEKSIDELHT